jgi:hypothetical protein
MTACCKRFTHLLSLFSRNLSSPVQHPGPGPCGSHDVLDNRSRNSQLQAFRLALEAVNPALHIFQLYHFVSICCDEGWDEVVGPRRLEVLMLGGEAQVVSLLEVSTGQPPTPKNRFLIIPSL